MALFNRSLLKQNRNRVIDKISQADFLHQEIAEIITQTILDCKRNFDNILEIGARDKKLGKQIANLKNAGQLIQTDLAIGFKPDLVMDDENLCFKEQSFDLVLSNLNLHFINDIPQNLIAIRKLLKPNGLFIASFFGEENLKELKEAFLETEQEIYGGITPRIAPNVDVKTAGMLLQKAGFVDVVAQKHSFEVDYSDPKKLFQDLRNMGEANILEGRSRKFMTKKFLFNLTQTYKNLYSARKNDPSQNFLTENFTLPQGEGNGVVTTFEIIILTGWKK